MVKEVDLGEKGAEKLSITPITKNKGPACKKNSTGEIEIRDNWAGYFAGVKGQYVFFDKDDGWDGGYPFVVFDSKNGEKLFSDSKGMEAFRSITSMGDDLIMRYPRVYRAKCSLYKNKSACWKKIMSDVNIISNASPPDCTKVYEAEQKRSPKYFKEIADYPSVIGYETETVYKQGKVIFTGLPGDIKCWLPD